MITGAKYSIHNFLEAMSDYIEWSASHSLGRELEHTQLILLLRSLGIEVWARHVEVLRNVIGDDEVKNYFDRRKFGWQRSHSACQEREAALQSESCRSFLGKPTRQRAGRDAEGWKENITIHSSCMLDSYNRFRSCRSISLIIISFDEE